MAIEIGDGFPDNSLDLASGEMRWKIYFGGNRRTPEQRRKTFSYIANTRVSYRTSQISRCRRRDDNVS
eukprot:scaffold7473_cov118-Skeletonema_menzelii.AAC.6